MADKKISELPLITAISGSIVYVPIVHDGITEKITVENFSNFTNKYAAQTGSANIFTANQTINANLSVSGTSTVSGNASVGGNLVVNGKLTAQELFTEITSASIIFESGSTIFGNSGDDTHQFTGVVSINGVSIGAGAINEFTASQLAVNLRIASTTGSINTTTSSFNSEFIKIGLTTSSIHFTTQSLNTQTGSQDLVNLRISSTTGSINTTTSSFDSVFLRISSTTGSINTTTSSFDSVFLGISSVTGAMNTTTSSFNSEFVKIGLTTSSIHFTTQSLNTQTGSQGNLNAQIGIATGSLNAFTSSVIGQTNTISTFTGSVNFTTQSLNTQTGSQNNINFNISVVTASIDAHILKQATQTGSQDLVNYNISVVTSSINAHILKQAIQTGSQDLVNYQNSIITSSFRIELNSIEAYTSSLKSAIIVNGSNVQIIGELNVNKLNVQYISSSVLLTSGSNIFGDAVTDKHEFTGSVSIKDTLFVNGHAIGLGELNAFTGSQIGKDGTLAIVTSSLRAEIGGIEAYTASLKAATIVSSSTQIFTGYDYEIHVSQVDGNDTTGNGDLLTPVATITKALQIVTANFGVTDRRTIILHPGTYTENPTISIANTYIFALGLLGANTVIAGTLTINAACRVSGIKMTNLVVNTTAAVYINNTTVDTQMTVTNTGYLETTGCSFQCTSGVTVSGAAPGVVFNSTTLWGLVVSNASAIVVVRNSPQVVVAIVTAGNLALSNTLLYSATPTGNAITTSAGSVVTLSNLNILDNTALAVARVSLSGFYSIIDVVYDKPNSTLVALSGTGGSTNAIDYFQYINADKFITQGGTGYQFLKGDGSLDSIMPASLQQTTASLNTYTGSNDSVVARILQTTASLNTFTGSIQSEVSGIEAYTASLKGAAIVSSSQQITNYYKFAETASANTFYGNQTFASSGGSGLRVYGGAGTHQWDMYLNGQNIRLSDNTAGDGALIVDTRAYFGGHVTASSNLTANKVAIGSTVTPTVQLEVYGQQKWFTSTGDGSELRGLFAPGGAADDPQLTMYKADGTTAGIKLTPDGIDFSANSNVAGMTSELLDDYEEGTFTATVVGGTTAGTGTYSRQVGVYTKIGNLVTCNVWIQWSAHTGTGDLFFGGFPFTSVGTTNYRASGVIAYFEDLTLTAGFIPGLVIVPSSTQASAPQNPVGGGAIGASVQIDTAANIHFSITYQTV